MNSRGRNLPGTFATTDLHSAHLGNGWFDADKENVYRMGLYGQCTPRTYGELLTVQKAALRKNQVPRWTIDPLLVQLRGRPLRVSQACQFPTGDLEIGRPTYFD